MPTSRSGCYYRFEVSADDLSYVLDLLDLMAHESNYFGDFTGENRKTLSESLREAQKTDSGSAVAHLDMTSLLYLLDVLGDSPDTQDQRVTQGVERAVRSHPAYVI